MSMIAAVVGFVVGFIAATVFWHSAIKFAHERNEAADRLFDAVRADLKTLSQRQDVVRIEQEEVVRIREQTKKLADEIETTLLAEANRQGGDSEVERVKVLLNLPFTQTPESV